MIQIDNKYRYNDTRPSYEIYYIVHYNNKILNNVANQ